MPFVKKIDIGSLTKRVETWNTTQRIKKQQLGLLPNIWSNNNIGMYRQRFYALQGNETGIDQISREQIVRLSRELFFQLPGIGVASEFKAGYVVGNDWKFEFKSKNENINKEFESFINDTWYNNCSTKGAAYDFKQILKVLSRTLDMDGDVGMLFVKNKNDYPLVQFIGSHRIGTAAANMSGNKGGTTAVINGNTYAVLDGVVYDNDGKPIGYSIKADDAQIATVGQDKKEPSKDKIVLAENMQLIFEPLVFDKGRGLPALYAAVLYGLQIQDLDNFLMDIAKLEASIAYIIQNDAGAAPQEYENLLNQIQAAGVNNNLTSLPSLEPSVHGVTSVKGPTINYIKSDGGDLKSFASDRPSEEIQSYIKTIETKLLSTIGVPHQLIYSPDTISGRAVNAVTQMVNHSVIERQKLIKKYARTMVAYALSSAMEAGYISKYYDENIFDLINFVMPPPFTLDSNSDANLAMDEYKLGLISGQQYSRLANSNFDDITAERDTEITKLLEYVGKQKKLHPELDAAFILSLYTLRGQSTLSVQSAPDEPIVKK